GHELPRVHDGGDLLAELGALGARLAQHVPRRELGDAVALRQALGLRALAGSRRPEENDEPVARRRLVAHLNRSSRAGLVARPAARRPRKLAQPWWRRAPPARSSLIGRPGCATRGRGCAAPWAQSGPRSGG